MNTPQQPPYPPQVQQPPYYNVPQPKPPFNWFGLLGFVCSLLTFVCLIVEPITTTYVWLAALVFSIIGLFFKRRGFAIAGLVISLLELLLIVILAVFLGIMFLSSPNYNNKPWLDEPADSTEVVEVIDPTNDITVDGEPVVGFEEETLDDDVPTVIP